MTVSGGTEPLGHGGCEDRFAGREPRKHDLTYSIIIIVVIFLAGDAGRVGG